MAGIPDLAPRVLFNATLAELTALGFGVQQKGAIAWCTDYAGGAELAWTGTAWQPIGSGGTTASAFFQVSFEIGNDDVILDGNGQPFGAQLFNALFGSPSDGNLVFIFPNGGNSLLVGVWQFATSAAWTRAPGYTTTDILNSPVIVQVQGGNAQNPRLWHVKEDSDAPHIIPGASFQQAILFALSSDTYITDLSVPNFAKFICTVDLTLSPVTVGNVITCGFMPLEDPPEAVNDFEELERMSVHAVAGAGFIRFFLYAPGAMTGSYRVWYTIKE